MIYPHESGRNGPSFWVSQQQDPVAVLSHFMAASEDAENNIARVKIIVFILLSLVYV